jgi:hypothetical protein
MYEAAASCKDIARAPVTNWEPHGVTLAGYGYAVRHGMKVQLVTLCRVSHLQCYGVAVGGNVTSLPTLSKTRVSNRKKNTRSLTVWCRLLLEKLTGLQVIKKFTTFYGTGRFITALTSVRHLSLSWASPIQSTYSHPTQNTYKELK